MTSNYNKQVYILSLEANDIYSHMKRDTSIKYDYCGMIPYSLELIKLKKEGLKVKYIESRNKEISNDIINVKFNQKVKSGRELQKILDKKLKENSESEKYVNKVNEFLGLIKGNELDDKWNEVSVGDLRKQLYNNGFTIKFTDRKSKTVKEIEYVVYKRSSSKSRTGQCLFIKKSLYNKMIKWSRMGLPLRKNMKIDLAGLLAYESLVGSSLEDTIKIDSEKILIVDDVDSKFKKTCNVVRKGKDGFLDSFIEETEVSNSLFDGESLLDSKYFEDGIAMKLLRNHMFKSAAFNCNIQLYLKDNCPENVAYEDWQLKDMFGNLIFAKDVELICTPSSLKALKFSSVIGSDSDMWVYWKKIINEDNNVFGVCKHDKQSKFGEDENGNVLQQTSYQMINCLPIKQEDIEELSKTEKKYIDRLKNDDDFFIEKVKEASSMINSNEMLVTLYNNNPKIIQTALFRKFRKDFIWGHMNHSKKGKIKLKGDYCVMLGNPMEFLKHAINKFNINDVEYKAPLLHNEVYTRLFDFDKEYVGFRNPNTSPSNVLIVQNKKVEDIERYFNLTENIVCVNAIDFPIQDILSGCDYDSDTVLLFDDPKILELGKRCFGKYYVCINQVEGQKKKYQLNKNDMYEIDNQLSNSQRDIGKVVNLGQFCMSLYWHLLNNGESGEHVNELLRKVDVMTVLSGISIDMAKKFYEIDIDKEINNVSKNNELRKKKKKPMFWKYVSQSKTIDNRIEPYECPMDYLIKELNSLEKAIPRQDMDFGEFLIELNSDEQVNVRQRDKVISHVRRADNLSRNKSSTPMDQEEKFNIIVEIMKECANDVKRLKIKEHTMLAIIKKVSKSDTKIIMKLLKILHDTHKETFLKVFKYSEKRTKTSLKMARTVDITRF